MTKVALRRHFVAPTAKERLEFASVLKKKEALENARQCVATKIDATASVFCRSVFWCCCWEY